MWFLTQKSVLMLANHKITIFGHNLTVWRGSLCNFLRRARRFGTFAQLTGTACLSAAHFSLGGLWRLKIHQKVQDPSENQVFLKTAIDSPDLTFETDKARFWLFCTIFKNLILRLDLGTSTEKIGTWTGEGSFGVTSRVSPPSMTSFLGDVIGLLDESERLDSEVVKFDSAIDIRLLSTSECCIFVSSSSFLSHNNVITQKIGSKSRPGKISEFYWLPCL